jgi:type VI protein secretion system component VasK
LNSFWDWIWLTLWIFALIVLIWVIIAIISDLFRNHESSGWVKALWIIFLIIAPWLAALIYLIVNHKGMAERSIAAAEKAQKQQQQYIQSVAGTSPAEQIKHAKDLLDAGTIDQTEYDQLKSKALAS